MHKNLTIAIPTFNRAESLRVTLESLDLALKKINPNFQVEVLISNNASTDSTADVCLRYQHFEYFQQPINLGYDENVAFLYEKACGEYLLLLSDDDVFECEGFLELVSSIEKNPLTDVFFCNWYSATEQLGKKSQMNSLITANSPKFEYSLIKNITPFYFLSSFVLRKVPVNTEILIRGTYAIQMEIALQILNDQSKCRVVDDFLVGRIEPETELIGGNNDSSRAWRIHLGFTRVRRKYQSKFKIPMSPLAELSSSLTVMDYFRNPNFPLLKRVVTVFVAVSQGLRYTSYIKLIELPRFLFHRYI